MGIEIVPYREELVEAVKAFNQRLRSGGIAFEFSEAQVPAWLSKAEGREIYHEHFLAAEKGLVRGGYVLKRQPFWINGEVLPIGNLQLPLSEGVVDRTYRALGMSLLTDAVRRQPLLYALGMGGTESRVVKMLQALGWTARLVPFYFRVVHPARFLRRIRYLRTTSWRRGVADALAATGTGWLGITLGQAIIRRRGARRARPRVEVVADFASWSDALWDMGKTDYAFAGVRNATALNLLYERSNPRFIRLKVSRGGDVVGWAVVLATAMHGHKQFGDMNVGSIVDCFGRRGSAELVMEAATGYLERSRVDLIVSNQSAHMWGQALQRAGYWRGPSNFVFAASRELSRLVEPFDVNFNWMQVNRGDGDGPIHL